MKPETVFLGLGSNLGDSLHTLHLAIEALHNSAEIQLVAQSPVYRSKPLDDMDQPAYYNMVVECQTTLEAEALLDVCQAIEEQFGRIRHGQRWQPRTLDIDILAYGHHIIKNARLFVPHPGIVERDFVLYPWNDIATDFQLPLLGTIASLCEACPDRGLEKIVESDHDEYS